MGYVKFVQTTPSLLQPVRLSVSARTASSDLLQIPPKQLAPVRIPALYHLYTLSSLRAH